MKRADARHARSFWQFQVIGWGCFYLSNLLAAVPQILSGHDSVYQETVPIVFMFLGSCGLRPVCRRLLRQSRSWLSFEIKATVWAVVAGILIACGIAITMQDRHHVDWLGQAPIAVWSASVLFMWCSLYFSIQQWQQSNDEKERLHRAESEVREARLLALRYQLNPHFLFNSLNAVSTLILDGNASAATRMLAQIGDLLRSSLDSEVTTEVTLSQELAFTEGFLAIEQTRLGERLEVKLAIPSATQDVMVPSMLLQPLVENAIRHGVAPLIEGGWIAIESAIHADRVRIVVANSGRPNKSTQNDHGNGIGLGNTAERLKTLYGKNFEFSLEWPEAGGCEVVLELPLRRAGNLQEAATCAR